MCPDSEAKMNSAGWPGAISNPELALNTWPVGLPPGMVTTSGTIDTGVAPAAPR